MTLALLFRLLFAHILSDFFLQTDKMNEGKNVSDNKRWLYQLTHSSIHAFVTYLFVSQWRNWIIPLVIFVSHFIIDSIKSSLKAKDIQAFVIDQVAHLLVILALWLYITDCDLWQELQSLLNVDNSMFWKLLIGYALMLKPSSLFMSLLLKRWNVDDSFNNSLPNAGQWIGYLERILIFTFIISGSLDGVGFLLAAKSVFRFGDLNKAKDIKTTEYVLVGTLTSFTIAILTGFIIK